MIELNTNNKCANWESITRSEEDNQNRLCEEIIWFDNKNDEKCSTTNIRSIYMKRLFASLLVLCVVLSLSICAAAAETNSDEYRKVYQLSSLNEEQCRSYLLEHGVAIPDELRQIQLKELFAALEENPDLELSLGWTVLGDFIEEVRAIVKSHYGIATAPSPRALTYTLQYSTLHSWDSSTMKNYNCYAYAIDRGSICQPGDFSYQDYDDSASISTFARLIKDDLNGSLGRYCVKIQSNRPSSKGTWLNVLAVRKDTTRDAFGINDYHFAKLSSSGWYHKPGKTAVLKFISSPSNNVDWTNENYNGTYNSPTVTYDSDLRYLLYKTYHGSTTYLWTGEHYHSGSSHYYLYAYVCNDCGDYTSTVWTSSPCSGPPCELPINRIRHPQVCLSSSKKIYSEFYECER